MLQFSTKSNVLKALQGKTKRFTVLPQICFTVQDLILDPESICKQVESEFPGMSLIVRSSAIVEDTNGQSMAGKFLSVTGVLPNLVIDAANKVMDSFGDNVHDNQIFVQPELRNISMSGVLFSVDPNNGGNYFVINYDDFSGFADTVTSGEGKNLSTCYIFHGKLSGDTRLNRLCEASQELMELFDNTNIDIEFAFTNDGSLYLLQVRPLVLKHPVADPQIQSAALMRAHNYITSCMRPHPYASGKRSIFGVMPDWNPAEMIGIRPRPLASSLYRRLITDGVWAYQRDGYGYKNLRSFPLMVEFCGLPYIDIRASFNSFIPKNIENVISDKLADYYLKQLEADPGKHDKVEFEIVFSSNTFDLPNRVNALSEHGFTSAEIAILEDSLCTLTNNIINVKEGLWITDVEKIAVLDKRRDIVIGSDMDDISKIYWLLEDCARYGTLPFAGLARAGFVAVQLLKSLVAVGILSDRDYQNYIGSLSTVSSQISDDWKELSNHAFLRKYGHLRPGTYDITSKRYDAAPEVYLGVSPQIAPYVSGKDQDSHDIKDIALKGHQKNTFALTIDQYAAIQEAMKARRMDGDVLALFKFLKTGIEGREYAKFVFTKSLSHALELFADLGARYGLNRDDMSYMDASIINRLYSTTDDVKSALLQSISEGRKRYEETLSVTMPPVILSPDDIYAFHMPSGVPNFITLGAVSGEVCSHDFTRANLSGKIMLVPAADPGYDWVFSCDIMGFVTAYGGANSHMAIRAGELGIPAVIGIGEKEYNRLCQAKVLSIDCANKKIEILR